MKASAYCVSFASDTPNGNRMPSCGGPSPHCSPPNSTASSGTRPTFEQRSCCCPKARSRVTYSSARAYARCSGPRAATWPSTCGARPSAGGCTSSSTPSPVERLPSPRWPRPRTVTPALSPSGLTESSSRATPAPATPLSCTDESSRSASQAPRVRTWWRSSGTCPSSPLSHPARSVSTFPESRASACLSHRATPCDRRTRGKACLRTTSLTCSSSG